jgi:mRNA interferase RelE/StbE
MYQVKFTKTAFKNLKKIQREDQQKILNQIELLAASPDQKSSVKKLTNSAHYRLRVGNYRIIFDREDILKIIDIIDILHRKDAYKRS